MEDNQTNNVSREMYSGVMNTQNSDIIRWIASPQDRVSVFIKQLAGKRLNTETGHWEAHKDELLMNEKGEKFWESTLRSASTTDMILTKYNDEADINAILRPLIVDALSICRMKRKEFGIESLYITFIAIQVLNQMKGNLLRALHGGERKFYNMHTTHDIKQVEQPPQKVGYFGGLFGKK